MEKREKEHFHSIPSLEELEKIGSISPNCLINADCLLAMKYIENNSIDMILTDPPYGTTACKWDSIIPFEPMWKELKRIVKPNGAIVLFGSQPFTTKLIMSNIEMFKYEWVWDKHISRGFQTAKYKPMVKHENILVFGESKINYYPIKTLRDKPVTVKNYSKKNKISSNSIGKYNDSSKSFTYTHINPNSIITNCWEPNRGKIHPTQKPISLGRYLVRTYTNESDTVLDFAAGSFTFCISALLEKRNFIGIEKDEKYFETGKERIESCLLTKEKE